MKKERKKLLAKLAYLYYIEDKSQAEIAKETGIYRTSVSRMLSQAKQEGIVKIDIQEFDRKLYQLEKYVKDKYQLAGLEIVENLPQEDKESLEKRLGQVAANVFVQLITNYTKIGFSWGKSLSLMVEHIGTHRSQGLRFLPIAGGPSHIHARFHVNTLIYDMANKFHGECSFINATIIQENKDIASGILSSKYFQELKRSWNELDIAAIGIGGKVDENNPQWLDMLTASDFRQLEVEEAVGESCCRCFDAFGHPLYSDLQERTIAIPLDILKKIPKRFALAYGQQKAASILACLRAGYINYLVTDEETIVQVLELDQDKWEMG